MQYQKVAEGSTGNLGPQYYAPPPGAPPQAPYGQPYYPPQGAPSPYAQPYQQQYAQQPPYGQQQYGQEQYAQPQYPPPGPAPYYNPQQTSSEEKFTSNTKFKDLWATILFILHLGGFAVTAYFGIKSLHFSQSNTSSSNAVLPPGKHIAGIVLACVGTGFVLSFLYFIAMQRFAGKLIKATFIFSIILLVAFAVFYFYLRQLAGGVITLVLALLYAWCYWAWRSRFPFAKLMLKTVTGITAKYPATLFVGVLGVIIQCAWSALWILSLFGITEYFTRNNTSNGARYVTYIFMIFSFYWTVQVIMNTVHVIVSGVFATYYFLGTANADGTVTVSAPHPTASSTKRALTTSFGPICFGSLVIALIQTLRALLRSAANENAAEGNVLAAFLAMCAACFLGCIEDLVQYFNKYAFTQVAIYGKDYVSAAKATWTLVKSRGIDAIINDNLIGNVLSFGGLLVAAITAIVGYIYIRFAPDVSRDTSYYVVVILFGFFVGASEFGILAQVIDSGVSTTFVCLAEDPDAVRRTKPNLYNSVVQVYPQVQIPGGSQGQV